MLFYCERQQHNLSPSDIWPTRHWCAATWRWQPEKDKTASGETHFVDDTLMKAKWDISVFCVITDCWNNVVSGFAACKQSEYSRHVIPEETRRKPWRHSIRCGNWETFFKNAKLKSCVFNLRSQVRLWEVSGYWCHWLQIVTGNRSVLLLNFTAPGRYGLSKPL